MISIRKYMDNSKDRLASSSLLGWRTSLIAMAESAERAVPGLGQELKQGLSAAEAELATPPNTDVLEAVQATVEKELAAWADKAYEYHVSSVQQISEIMATVSQTSDSVARRDESYVKQIGDLNGQLCAIAELNSIPVIRASILESTRALKACIDKMAEEGREALRKLTDEVNEYRIRLEEIEQIATADALTHLANRRGFEKHLADRIAKRKDFCLIMLDLDGFKAINDQYGHLAGDDLLRQFAHELKTQFRSEDHVARWGGDEFVAVIGSNLDDSYERVQQIRRWVLGEYKLQSSGKIVKVIIEASIGVAEWNRNETAAQLIARADAKLYALKSGRVVPIKRIAS